MSTIRIIALNTGALTPFDGQYVKEYDPTRPGTDPDGKPMIAHIVCTPEREDAMQFETGAQALAFYSQAHGKRPDGKPNKPLTAFMVEIE